VPDVVSFLLRELNSAPELWVQKGYLCRVLRRDGASYVDEGVLPVAHFLDSSDGPGVAATIEVDESGRILPTLYIRRNGAVVEHMFEPHPLHDYEAEPYRTELERVLGQFR
jgi:hypothetical protein